MNYFTNPYNFVPLEGKCIRRSISLGKEECMTGYFACTMELLTPLFIPNTSNPQALCDSEERKGDFLGYEFSSYEDLSGDTERNVDGYTNPPKAPVICGSEIRGSVRSVYEAAFGGCMSTTVVDGVLSRRHPKNKKPGILRKKNNGDYEIVPCKRAMLYVDRPNLFYDKVKFGRCMPEAEYNSLKEGQKIWVKLSKNDYKSKNKILNVKVVEDYRISQMVENKPNVDTFVEGWLHKGEPFGNKKHHESIFYEEGRPTRIVTENEIKLLRKVLSEYRDLCKKVKSAGCGYPEFDLDRDQILVYYCDDKNLPAYLSPACIGKELYTKTLETILEANGGFQPCSGRKALCPACRLFGMVSPKDEGKSAVGSRVRFTDATLKNPADAANQLACYMKPLVLPESGEPRPGAAEFYTLPPYEDARREGWSTEGYWTYDYKCIKEHNKVIRKSLPDDLPMIRGRKFYWHNDNWKKYADKNKLEHVMQQRIRPVKASNSTTGERQFSFRVYFDKISREELECLRWSLDFSDSECAHKLGRGKPFGFGSVKIHIDDLKIQKAYPETGELKLISTDYKGLGVSIDENGEAMKSLKLMANWKNRPRDVSYPVLYGAKEGESFRWFVKNRKNVDSKGMQPAFSKILPKASEELGENRNQKRRLNKDQ